MFWSKTTSFARELSTARRFGVFQFSNHDAKGHAVIAALVGWLGVLAFSGVVSGYCSISGPLRRSDFVHF